MNIVCLYGSPRPRGNSAAMADQFLDSARKSGHQIETFRLNKLNYKGCQACYTCRTKLERCVLEDDLTAVLDSIRACDILVLATPVYFGDITSQMKAFIDRNL